VRACPLRRRWHGFNQGGEWQGRHVTDSGSQQPRSAAKGRERSCTVTLRSRASANALLTRFLVNGTVAVCRT
jgi:hypothetical protein